VVVVVGGGGDSASVKEAWSHIKLNALGVG
jgi:hypothetical protein